jgi:hypothetical protein
MADVVKRREVSTVARALVYCGGLGVLAWLIVHAALLPVVDVSDGQGHGPDIGSVEWHSAMVHQTQRRERVSAMAGLTLGVLSFAVWIAFQARTRRVPHGSG